MELETELNTSWQVALVDELYKLFWLRGYVAEEVTTTETENAQSPNERFDI